MNNTSSILIYNKYFQNEVTYQANKSQYENLINMIKEKQSAPILPTIYFQDKLNLIQVEQGQLSLIRLIVEFIMQQQTNPLIVSQFLLNAFSKVFQVIRRSFSLKYFFTEISNDIFVVSYDKEEKDFQIFLKDLHLSQEIKQCSSIQDLYQKFMKMYYSDTFAKQNLSSEQLQEQSQYFIFIIMMLEIMELIKYHLKNSEITKNFDGIMSYYQNEVKQKILPLLFNYKDQFSVTLYNLTGFFHSDFLYFFTNLMQNSFELSNFQSLFDTMHKKVMSLKVESQNEWNLKIEPAKIAQAQFSNSFENLVDLKSIVLLLEIIKLEKVKVGIDNCKKINEQAKKIMENEYSSLQPNNQDLNQLIDFSHQENDWQNELYFAEKIKQNMLNELKNDIPEKFKNKPYPVVINYQLCLCYQRMANICERGHYYGQSIQLYEAAMAILEKLQGCNSDQIAEILQKIGLLQLQLKQYEDAIYCFKQALEIGYQQKKINLKMQQKTHKKLMRLIRRKNQQTMKNQQKIQ
eukprot:TRINITY_DN10424_c0_g1_i1.p1 TRINITY_DN10424_c0_g1~~TRINITY_DN10424_c0_g1_i1.p1  ORF type:complete len:518 (+),score=89.41 TRINITY_DN10424_c0_g1_i1:1-1554(+)